MNCFTRITKNVMRHGIISQRNAVISKKHPSIGLFLMYRWLKAISQASFLTHNTNFVIVLLSNIVLPTFLKE